jgi:hypothetical protein
MTMDRVLNRKAERIGSGDPAGSMHVKDALAIRAAERHSSDLFRRRLAAIGLGPSTESESG